MTREYFVGIDLGTSNSAAAIFERGHARVVPNEHGEMLTPSAVGLRPDGNVVVGRAAVELAKTDAARVAFEHKRAIGSPTAITLGDGTDDVRSAEELAALVLSQLRTDLSKSLGHEASQAVISIPASFGLAESSATIRAAQSAGFDRALLVQEPIAAALSLGMRPGGQGAPSNLPDGSWLVYDLGGGTFDASLLLAEEGFLQVVAHDGDPYLGGRDIDAALATWLAQRAGWPGIRDLAPSLWRNLRRAAESCKRALSHRDEVEVRLNPDADSFLSPLRVAVDRATLAMLTTPLAERSIELCHGLLAAASMNARALQGMVLVGGPTVMPCLRAALAEAMAGVPLMAVDPMTAVARGAARFAAASELPSQIRSHSRPDLGDTTYREVKLHHAALSADPTPVVVGRFIDHQHDDATVRGAAPDPLAPATVFARREDGLLFEATVSRDRSFCLKVELGFGAHHQFTLSARDHVGAEIKLWPASFSMTHGLHLDEPPLNRNVGIALADDRVKIYFEHGTPLPAKRRFRHRTVEHLCAESDAGLRIPIVEGNHDRAHLCHPVGWLEVKLKSGQPALPAGSEVDIELQLDRSGRLQARARLPGGLGTVENIERLLVPQADLASLQRSIGSLRRRLNTRLAERFRGQRTNATQSDLLERVVNSLASLDGELGSVRLDESDELNRLRHRVMKVDASLSQLEDDANLAQLEAQALETLTWANTWVRLRGSERELEMLDEINQGMVSARDRGDAVALGRQTRLAAELGQSAWLRDPRAWTQLLDSLCSRLDDALDLPQAQALAERGRVAAADEAWAELRSTVDALRALMPPSAAVQQLAHGSAVR